MKKRRFIIGQPLTNVGLVSVIVPVYNAEKFLKYSLESLQNQTYPFWEAVLINDGSTDNSLSVMQQYALGDSRFKIITQPNGGVASARNTGLAAVHGDYIAFLDPDDMLCPQFMEIMLKALLQSEAGMAWCKKKKCNESDSLKVCDTYSRYYAITRGFALNWFVSNLKPHLTITVWGKLYKANVLKNLRFHSDFKVMAEDFEFSLRAFELCSKTVCVQRKLVVYRQNSASLTHRPLSFAAIDDHIRLLRYAVWHFRDSLDRPIRHKLWHLLSRMVLLYTCIFPYQQAGNYTDFWDKYRPLCLTLH
ncbi:MAG: glycosyltransferase family 2 protein, partial [Alphaproteobacteria bacterium]|nr:glycosyltransferase family 2 protein [Alphaproteobacteria bacterium]